MRPEAILESALYVTDLGAAESFYAGVLGLDQISELEGRHVFFRCGRGVLLLFDAEATRQPPAADATLPVPPHGTTGEGHLCFAASAEEITRWKARARGKRRRDRSRLRWPSGGRSIYFRDPSGNSLEFAEPKIWPLRDEPLARRLAARDLLVDLAGHPEVEEHEQRDEREQLEQRDERRRASSCRARSRTRSRAGRRP